MKLLITTQKIDKNDSVLGFFHRWVEEFAKHCEQVTVICLEKGEFDLPSNVEVVSLGKEERNNGYIVKLLYGWRFLKYAWVFRKNYDRVFVHMNPEYVVLGGWLWKILRKKVSLWYVHRQVNLKLRVAEKFCDHIFSVSKESFLLPSKKVNFVGHGIDTKKFACQAKREQKGKFKIISVGRITSIKNLDVLISAIEALSEEARERIVVELVGVPVVDKDKEYLEKLKKQVADFQLSKIVLFVGSRPYSEMSDVYCQSDLLVNLAPTGGSDKAVLEAMACGLPVLVSNQAYQALLGGLSDKLMFKQNDASDLKDKLSDLIFSADRDEVGQFLRKQIIDNYGVEALIRIIISSL